MGLQEIPEVFADIGGAGSGNFRIMQCHQLPFGKQVLVFIDMVECVEQLFRDSELPCQGSMRGHSVEALIDLRDTNC